MNTNKQEQKVRKYTSYDSLLALTTQLLKKTHIEKIFKQQAKSQNIKLKRNRAIITLGLCMVQAELIRRGYQKNDALNEIFNYMKENMDRVLLSKYSSEDLRKLTKEKNLEEIQALECLLLMDSYQQAIVTEVLSNHLYKGQYNYNGRKQKDKFNNSIEKILQKFKGPEKKFFEEKTQADPDSPMDKKQGQIEIEMIEYQQNSEDFLDEPEKQFDINCLLVSWEQNFDLLLS